MPASPFVKVCILANVTTSICYLGIIALDFAVEGRFHVDAESEWIRVWALGQCFALLLTSCWLQLPVMLLAPSAPTMTNQHSTRRIGTSFCCFRLLRNHNLFRTLDGKSFYLHLAAHALFLVDTLWLIYGQYLFARIKAIHDTTTTNSNHSHSDWARRNDSAPLVTISHQLLTFGWFGLAAHFLILGAGHLASKGVWYRLKKYLVSAGESINEAVQESLGRGGHEDSYGTAGAAFIDIELRRDLKAARISAIAKLPLIHFQQPSCASRCAVCLEDFSCGEILRQLPCAHSFHVICADTWLMHHGVQASALPRCPLCRRDIFVS
jgi:hypothetical protein